MLTQLCSCPPSGIAVAIRKCHPQCWCLQVLSISLMYSFLALPIISPSNVTQSPYLLSRETHFWDRKEWIQPKLHEMLSPEQLSPCWEAATGRLLKTKWSWRGQWRSLKRRRGQCCAGIKPWLLTRARAQFQGPGGLQGCQKKEGSKFCLLNREPNLWKNILSAWTTAQLYSGQFCDNGVTPVLVWAASLVVPVVLTGSSSPHRPI